MKRIQSCPPEQRKYKGRVVLLGDNIRDEHTMYAVFQEVGSSAALIQTASILDLVASIPGNSGEQSDAPRAYTQADMSGTPCWVELPSDKRPPQWSKYRRPVVLLKRALYGHPMAGKYWENHYNSKIIQVGFQRVPGWEQTFIHKDLTVILTVYIDDFRMAGPTPNLALAWALLKKHL